MGNLLVALGNLFLPLGNDNYVNMDKVKLISAANAEKVRKYRIERNIDKNSVNFFNGSSDKETRSMILFCDGSICTSSVSAKALNERANKLAKEIKVVVAKSEDELD